MQKLHDLQGAGDGLLVAPEEPRHLGPALEMALGIGGQPIAGLRHGGAFADRGQHVLQGPALARVVVDVVGGDQRRTSWRSASAASRLRRLTSSPR